MSELASLLILLLVVLLAFVWPLRARDEVHDIFDEKGEAIAVYHQEVAHLKRQLAHGLITADTHAKLLRELDANSSATIRAIERQPLAHRRTLWVPLVVIAALAAATSGFFYHYQHSGEAQWAQFRQQHQEKISAALFNAEVVENHLATHTPADKQAFCFAMQQQLLVRYDSDAQALGNLARCHLRTGNAPLAAEAVARGLDNHPDDSGLNYAAAALDFAHNGRLSPHALDRLLFVLQGDPQHVKTLYLLALDSFQQGRASEARFFLNQLQRATADDPVLQTTIRQTFAELQAKMPARQITALKMTVRLTENLATSLLHSEKKPPYWVFVVAKSADGQLLNASKHKLVKATDTLNVTISDHQAGMKQLKPMAGQPSVAVLARLSQAGEPMPASGDFTSSAVVIKLPQQAPAALVIDQVMP